MHPTGKPRARVNGRAQQEFSRKVLARARHRCEVRGEGCLDIASRGGAQLMAGARPDGSALTEDARFGLAVGAPADFVLLEADTVTSAIMDCPSDRDVFRSGELIASGGQLLGGVRLS